MKITVPYGKEKIELDIPEKNILDIVQGSNSLSSINEEEIISRALESPVESNTLSEIARGKSSACILQAILHAPVLRIDFYPG